MEQKTMKALVFRGANDYGLQDMPVPQIVEPDDSIIRVTVNTICTSDVHIVHGGIPPITAAVEKNGPLTLGHEFCGEVVEVGPDVKGFKRGDRVVCLPGIHCGKCDMCKAGVFCLCSKLGMFGGGNLQGAQTEYVRIPRSELTMLKIPDGMTYEDVLLVPDMFGTAWFGLKNANVTKGQTVAVIGGGPVGQCTAMLAKAAFGAKTVVVFGRKPARTDAALKAGVADYVLSTLTDDIPKRVAEITGGLGFDAVIETPGTQESIDLSCAIVAVRGVVSTIAVFETPIVFPMQQIIFKNLTIKMGIQNADAEGMAIMMQLIAEGKLKPNYMLTHRSPLNDIMNAYKVFGNREDGCIKWLVYPYQN